MRQTKGYLLSNFLSFLMKSVVVTSKIDKLTVTAASKQIGLKKEVAQHIHTRRKEGRYVVNNSLVRRLLNTISIFTPFEGESYHKNLFIVLSKKLQYYLPGILQTRLHDSIKYCVSSVSFIISKVSGIILTFFWANFSNCKSTLQICNIMKITSTTHSCVQQIFFQRK